MGLVVEGPASGVGHYCHVHEPHLAQVGEADSVLSKQPEASEPGVQSVAYRAFEHAGVRRDTDSETISLLRMSKRIL